MNHDNTDLAASQKRLALDLLDTAIKAAQAETCLPPHLPEPPANGRLILLAAGKAAGAMMQVAERHYREECGLGPDKMIGLAVTRHGYAKPCGSLTIVEAGHPVPDQAGVDATLECLRLAEEATAEDLVVVLLSGGGSANWVAPAHGLTLADKQDLTGALLRSGATISEINTVRKHLSNIKGGRLARAVSPAKLVTLAISDVPGDDPDVIASGPTVPDPTTLAEARAICDRVLSEVPAHIRDALNTEANESPKPGDAAFAHTRYELIARPQASLDAAARVAREAGYDVIQLGDALEGEARELAAEHAAMACEMAAQGRKVVLLSGGEATVTIRGDGAGGPNQEYALALAIALDGHPSITGLAADTDGTDGGRGLESDPAGALVTPDCLIRANARGLDAAAFLGRNDSTEFFRAADGLLTPGPSYTNVNDFRCVIVDKGPLH